MPESGASRDALRAFRDRYRRPLVLAVSTMLQTIGFTGSCDVLLAGIPSEPTTPARVERGDDVAVLERPAIQERLDDLLANHTRTDPLHAEAMKDPDWHTALVDRLRGRALAELLAPQHPEVRLFSGRSVLVDDLHLYFLFAVDAEHLDQVPSFPADSSRRPRSLVHAVMEEVLTRVWRALVAPDTDDWVIPLALPTSDLIRNAAGNLVRTAFAGIGGTRITHTADMSLNAISALPYEGRAGTGKLVLAAEDLPSAEVLLRFVKPVALRERRTVRKLMEANDEHSALLVNRSGSVYALGHVQPDDEQAVVVSFLGRGAWDLMRGGRLLLSVRDGEARLPSPPLDEAAFRNLVDRLLPGADFEKLLQLAYATADHHHGAMLIISSDAAREAARLSPQCIVVQPTELSTDLATRLTSMDGAALVDPQGRCHAVGVILDGRATGEGDAARGSRFNNPIRYLNDNPPNTVILVFSSDGGVDTLPQLRLRMNPAAVRAAIERYVELVTAAPPVRGTVYEAWNRVSELEFYLSENDCSVVNRASARLRVVCNDASALHFGIRDLQPDPRMNDDYWLP